MTHGGRDIATLSQRRHGHDDVQPPEAFEQHTQILLCRFSASCLRNIGATPNYPEPQMENGAESHTRVILEIHSRCEENSYGGNCSGETKEQRGDKLYTVSFRSQFSGRVLSKTTKEPWMQGSRHTLPQGGTDLYDD